MNSLLKRKNVLLSCAIVAMALVLGTMIFMPLAQADAASVVFGQCNYNGSTYKCYFNIVGEADSVEDDQVFQATTFKITFIGIRDTGSSYNYNVNFKVYEVGNSTPINDVTFKQKVRNAANHSLVIVSKGTLSNGDYYITWGGQASRLGWATTFNGTAYFTLDA